MHKRITKLVRLTPGYAVLVSAKWDSEAKTFTVLGIRPKEGYRTPVGRAVIGRAFQNRQGFVKLVKEDMRRVHYPFSYP